MRDHLAVRHKRRVKGKQGQRNQPRASSPKLSPPEIHQRRQEHRLGNVGPSPQEKDQVNIVALLPNDALEKSGQLLSA